MKQVAVIIVAGGSGRRMGAEIPKQFLEVSGRPVLMHTLQRFAETIPTSRLILVLPHDRVGYWTDLCRQYDFEYPHVVCEGGDTRYDSVKSGLLHIGNCDIVAVHDGVRPLASPELIRRAVADARAYGAVVPVVKPVDSLRQIGGNGSWVVDRSNFRVVQTPQVFKREVILTAYDQPFDAEFTDDASVVEATGHTVYLSEGEYANIKLTTGVDIYTAEAMMGRGKPALQRPLCPTGTTNGNAVSEEANATSADNTSEEGANDTPSSDEEKPLEAEDELLEAFKTER